MRFVDHHADEKPCARSAATRSSNDRTDSDVRRTRRASAFAQTAEQRAAETATIFDIHVAEASRHFGLSRDLIDAYSFPMIRWAIKVLPAGLKDYPNIKALHDRIAADPAVQKVLAREAGK
jgi:glutathione S-transferase